MEWQYIHHKITEVGKLTRNEQIKLINRIPKVQCTEDLNDVQ